MSRSQPLRRLAARFAGDGPISLAPFAALTAEANDTLTHGVHRSEHFTGILRSDFGDSFAYRPSASLLGQEPGPLAVKATHAAFRVSGIAPAIPKTLYSLSDAGVLSHGGLVYCRRTRRAVAETAALWDTPAAENPLLSAPRFPAPRHLAGVTLSLVVRSAVSFFHFLHDALPRLHLLGSDLAAVDHVLVGGEPGSFASAWLDRAGVPSEKIIWAGPLTHFTCDQLLFTSELSADQQPTPWNLSAVRSVVRCPAPAPPGHRVVWLSRKSAGTRQFKWEDDLLRACPTVETPDLSQLTPAQQLSLFAETAVLIAPHGAGLTNIAFCPPGTQLVELFPEFPTFPLYARWAQVAGATAYWAVVDFNQPAQMPALVTALRGLLPKLT